MKVLRLAVGGICLAALVGQAAVGGKNLGQPAGARLAASSLGPHSSAVPSQTPDNPGREKYIVVLEDDANARKVAREHERKYNARVDFVYRHALQGYAARINPNKIPAIESEPEVLFIDVDEDPGAAPPAVARTAVEQPPQSLSNGLRRVDADESSTVSGDGKGAIKINVAVVDGGVQPDHPDLNVVNGVNCIGRDPRDFADRDGHGTFVAGFIGALDNSIGRVGVAPGARISAVRALAPDGVGFDSELLCGVDWIAGTRLDGNSKNDIAIANMSLAGPNGDPPTDDEACGAVNHDSFHHAVCRLVALGVMVVAAAGNDAIDFRTLGPGGYDEVLTVTAMADRDGQPGGLTPPPWTCDPSETSADDAAADWSNFATLSADQGHVVSAPGVCISSTFIGSTYAVWSGTSFASPIVAGTVALCISAGPCAGLTPAQIIQKIVADAAAYNQANPGYGFDGDPLRPRSDGKYYGYLINAGTY